MVPSQEDGGILPPPALSPFWAFYKKGVWQHAGRSANARFDDLTQVMYSIIRQPPCVSLVRPVDFGVPQAALDALCRPGCVFYLSTQ